MSETFLYNLSLLTMKAPAIAYIDWAPSKYFGQIYNNIAYVIFLHIMECLHNQIMRSLIRERDLYFFNRQRFAQKSHPQNS